MLGSMPVFLIMFSIARIQRSSELVDGKYKEDASRGEVEVRPHSTPWRTWRGGITSLFPPPFLFSFFLDIYTTTYYQLRVTMPLL